jgi:hypothetical protein
VTAMADSNNESGGAPNAANSELSPREQDRFLPIANVSRMMKKDLPTSAKISKDAKETVQECDFRRFCFQLHDQRKPLSSFGVQLLETIKCIWFSTAKWFWHSDTMMTVMMMNAGVDDEIEDSGNHFHRKMGLEYNSQKPFPQQNGFRIPVR